MSNPREYAFVHNDNTSHLAVCGICKPRVDTTKCAVCRKQCTNILKVFNI